MELEVVIRIEFYRIIFLLNKCLNLWVPTREDYFFLGCRECNKH